MASNSSNEINSSNIPQITTVIPGDFFPVFTTNGVKQVDYANLNIPTGTPSGGLLLTDTLTAVNINASGSINCTDILVNNVDFYSNTVTQITILSSNVSTLQSTTSALTITNSQVLAISSNQINDETNIVTLSTSQINLSANTTTAAISAALVALGFKRVYTQSFTVAWTAGSATITFTGIPSNVTSVNLGSILLTPEMAAATAVNAPMVYGATSWTPSGNAITISVYWNYTGNIGATLTLFY